MAASTPRKPRAQPSSRLRKFVSTKTGKVTTALLAGVLAGAIPLSRIPASQRAIVKKWRENAKLESMHRQENDARLLKDLRPSTLRAAKTAANLTRLPILDKLVDKIHLDRQAAIAEKERIEHETGQFTSGGPSVLLDALATLPDAEAQRRLKNLYRFERDRPILESNLAIVRSARAELEDYFLARAQRTQKQIEQTNAPRERAELKQIYLQHLSRAGKVAVMTSASFLLLAALISVSKKSISKRRKK